MLKDKLEKYSQNENFSILIVEDEIMILKPMEKIMKYISKQVMTANDGLQGWELYQKNSFSLVVTDLQMPNMSGSELVKNIKTLNPNQLIIVITAFREGFEVEEAKKNGADFILEKPFSLATFLEVLDEVYSSRQ